MVYRYNIRGNNGAILRPLAGASFKGSERALNQSKKSDRKIFEKRLDIWDIPCYHEGTTESYHTPQTKQQEEQTMTNEKICKILDLHSVPYFVKDGRVFADSMIAFTELFEIVEDLTNISRRDLYHWLGY